MTTIQTETHYLIQDKTYRIEAIVHHPLPNGITSISLGNHKKLGEFEFTKSKPETIRTIAQLMLKAADLEDVTAPDREYKGNHAVC